MDIFTAMRSSNLIVLVVILLEPQLEKFLVGEISSRFAARMQHCLLVMHDLNKTS